jgi:hypothetical protein
MKKLFIILLTVLIVSSPTFATSGFDEEHVMADALIARPLGLASIVVGATFFVISLPFSVISGNSDKATKVLLVKPINYTFKRPIGVFDYEKEQINSNNNDRLD